MHESVIDFVDRWLNTGGKVCASEASSGRCGFAVGMDGNSGGREEWYNAGR